MFPIIELYHVMCAHVKKIINIKLVLCCQIRNSKLILPLNYVGLNYTENLGNVPFLN